MFVYDALIMECEAIAEKMPRGYFLPYPPVYMHDTRAF